MRDVQGHRWHGSPPAGDPPVPRDTTRRQLAWCEHRYCSVKRCNGCDGTKEGTKEKDVCRPVSSSFTPHTAFHVGKCQPHTLPAAWPGVPRPLLCCDNSGDMVPAFIGDTSQGKVRESPRLSSCDSHSLMFLFGQHLPSAVFSRRRLFCVSWGMCLLSFGHLSVTQSFGFSGFNRQPLHLNQVKNSTLSNKGGAF